MLEVRDFISSRRLAALNRGLLVGLLCLFAHEAYLVVLTVVIVPNFASSNRISHRNIEGLLHRPVKNVRKLDTKHKPVKSAVLDGVLIAGDDLGRRLPLVEREAYRNQFFECKIAHANHAFDRGANQVNAFDSDIARIFGQRYEFWHVDTMHDERTAFEIIIASIYSRGKL